MNTEFEDEIDLLLGEYKQLVTKAETELASAKEDFQGFIDEAKDDAEGAVDKILSFEEKSIELLGRLEQCEQTAQLKIKEINSCEEISNSRREDISGLADELDEIGGDFKKLYGDAQGYYADIQEKRKKVQSAYAEIFGYEADGEYIEGIKGRIEKSFDEAKKSLKDLQELSGKRYEELEDAYEKLIREKGEGVDNILERNNREVEEIKKRINDLLPHALTAGLSSAFSKRREVMEIEIKSLGGKFFASMVLMVLITLAPVVLMLIVAKGALTADLMVKEYHKYLYFVIPVYMPILWLAMRFNKRTKLLERLVEEYAHKEVLSKTYEGLSREINNFNGGLEVELKEKLLFILLEANSENPGKLIKDYNRTDHPMFDALDKSEKLAASIEKLARIPGFRKLAASLSNYTDKVWELKNNKVEAVIPCTDRDGETGDDVEQENERAKDGKK